LLRNPDWHPGCFFPRTVETPSSSICRCAIAHDTIQFCALHENADQLLAACQYAKQCLANLTLSQQEAEDLTRHIVIAHLNNVIAAASKLSN
jgi:hypothetical protein